MAVGFYVERWVGVLFFAPQNHVDTACRFVKELKHGGLRYCTNANSWFILNPLAYSNQIIRSLAVG